MLILAVLIVLNRNSTAKWVGEKVGSRLLGTHVEIGEVDIGWHAIEVQNIVVFEPNSPTETQLDIASLKVVPALHRGFGEGIWIDQVVIKQPTLHLRFDDSGCLVSVFPAGGESSGESEIGRVPVEDLLVQSASLIVHQPGRKEFRIERVDVAARFNDSIKARVIVPEVLAGAVDFRCVLDAASLSGKSRLTVTGIEIDSAELATLPLVPSSFGDDLITATVSCQVFGDHPAGEGDVQQHRIRCETQLASLRSQRFGVLCQKLTATAMQDNGHLSIDVAADPLQGMFALHSEADLTKPSPTATLTTSLADCDLSSILRTIPALAAASISTGHTAQLNMAWHEDKIEFDGVASADVSKTAFRDVSLPTATAHIKVVGQLNPREPQKLDGSVVGRVEMATYDLAEATARLGVGNYEGEVSVTSNFNIPLARISDPTSYDFDSEVRTSGVAASDFRLRDTTIVASLHRGTARLRMNAAEWVDRQDRTLASIKADAEASLADGGSVTVATEAFGEATSSLAAAIGISSLQPAGRLRLVANASSVLASASEPTSWKASTDLRGEGLSLAGESFGDINIRADLDGGRLDITPIPLRWRDSQGEILMTGTLGQRLTIRGDARIDRLRLTDVSKVVSRFSNTPLPAEGSASVHGTFALASASDVEPATLQASGDAILREARYAGSRVGDATLGWSADLAGLSVSTGSDDFMGGRFTASARMQELDWTKTQLAGEFTDVSVSRLAALSNQRFHSAGTIDGGFSVASIATLESLTGRAWLTSRQMSVHHSPIDISKANFNVTSGDVRAECGGQFAGGKFSGVAESNLRSLATHFGSSGASICNVPVTLQAQLTGLPVQKVVDAIGMSSELRSLDAKISGTCSRDQAAWDGRHLCRVVGTIEDLRWDQGRWSERISADIAVHASRIDVTGIDGRFADGSLAGSASIDFETVPTGRFEFAANRVSLRRATSPLRIDDVSGSGTVRVRGRIGPVITGRADVTIDNAVAAGISVRQASFPVDWSFATSSKTARWQCRAGDVSLGGGNVRIASEGSYTRSLNMTTSIRIEKVEMSKLMQGGSPASGTINGEMKLRAKQARTPQQFVGDYAFQFENIQALEVPILNQLPKMLSLSPSVPGRGQDGGSVHGRIGGGLVYIDELALHQSNVQVLVSGSATMEGNLNMDVVASTGSDSPTDQLLTLLDSPLMLAAPAPVALVAKANELLKDRVVRVHVTGTASQPTMRIQPGKQLSQDAVRFFLTSRFGPNVNRLSDAQSDLPKRY